MQVDIDFEVFKALTTLRLSESDSYNAVIRRLLSLPTENAVASVARPMGEFAPPATNSLAGVALGRGRKGLFGSGGSRNVLTPENSGRGLLGMYLGGVWFGNVHFPEGTKFRATYKGQTYYAEVEKGQWVGADGIARTSPSDAAHAITKTNVNGWRFWFVQMPDDPSWRKLDELKQ